MELQNPPAQLNFPNSPPPTPNAARARNPSTTSFYAAAAAARRKRQGIAAFGISPPEYIAPRGGAHQFSYTPPNRDRQSDSESDAADDESEESDDDDEDSEDDASEKGKKRAASSDHESEISERRPSIVRALDEDTDFTVEDLSDNDIGHDHLEIVHPDQIEDARSDLGSKASERDIIDRLKDLNCGREEELERARQFERTQRENYRRRQKRWSMGGYKKRSHAQSVGSQSSGHEDIEPLDDIQLPGASARRLRRRTQGPEDQERPNRTSLMFDDPPRELEELAVDDEPPPPLLDSDDEWSDDEDSDGIEDIELLLPHWLMDLESNPPSRPSTAVSIASAIHDASTTINTFAPA